MTGKISLREPSAAAAKLGAVSIDELLDTANAALKEEGLTIWILLDRLDVAFSNMPELEASALRALFKYYLDTKQLGAIRPKIFLRTDIWRDIVEDGFREASHLEKTLTITWRSEDILNLVVRRLLSNSKIVEYYGVDKGPVLADADKQTALFYKVSPPQVDSGPNKPDTLKWLITRTSDASKAAAPRELIHMLNELRNEQIKKLERGDKVPSEARLFEQTSFKDALPSVSQTRLEQTLYAEYARLKPFVEKLREQRATQSLQSLSALWNLNDTETSKIIADLEEAGFFEKFGKMWRVPFLYRPALGLVQGAVGAADEDD
ncbi:P-loop ATPase, Sll1717 family [Rhizobium sp. RAF56]|uniref:P-loop ATPase, Sll1717 family n=1 Tax=Rhizobium sp. RAF56 TaxID=3233062 RepID=UPI003F9B2500